MLLRDEQVAYLSGVFDSDGWMTIAINKRGSYTFAIGITQADMQAVSLALDIFGGTITEKLPHSGSKDIRASKILYDWRLKSSESRAFLDATYPHLRIKKDRAVIFAKLLEMCSSNVNKSRITDDENARRHSLYLQYKASY